MEELECGLAKVPAEGKEDEAGGGDLQCPGHVHHVLHIGVRLKLVPADYND